MSPYNRTNDLIFNNASLKIDSHVIILFHRIIIIISSLFCLYIYYNNFIIDTIGKLERQPLEFRVERICELLSRINSLYWYIALLFANIYTTWIPEEFLNISIEAGFRTSQVNYTVRFCMIHLFT